LCERFVRHKLQANPTFGSAAQERHGPPVKGYCHAYRHHSPPPEAGSLRRHASADFAIIRRGITNAQAAADDAGGRSGAPGEGAMAEEPAIPKTQHAFTANDRQSAPLDRLDRAVAASVA